MVGASERWTQYAVADLRNTDATPASNRKSDNAATKAIAAKMHACMHAKEFCNHSQGRVDRILQSGTKESESNPLELRTAVPSDREKFGETSLHVRGVTLAKTVDHTRVHNIEKIVHV